MSVKTEYVCDLCGDSASSKPFLHVVVITFNDDKVKNIGVCQCCLNKLERGRPIVDKSRERQDTFGDSRRKWWRSPTDPLCLSSQTKER